MENYCTQLIIHNMLLKSNKFFGFYDFCQSYGNWRDPNLKSVFRKRQKDNNIRNGGRFMEDKHK